MPKTDQTPLARCKRASQRYPGAPISRVQLAAVEDGLSKGQKACASRNRSQLIAYATTGDRAKLTNDAVIALLRDVNAMYAKSWARKSAAIMGDAIVTRPPRKRSRASEPQPEPSPQA